MTDDFWIWSNEQRIPSDAGAGRRVVHELLAQLQLQQWIEHDIFSIHLALEEALINAIKHGNGHDVSKQVQVVCRIAPNRVRIEITDEGEGFCLEEVPDPTDNENLEVPSGRGLMLMRCFMSLVEFNDVGNCVVLEKLRAEID